VWEAPEHVPQPDPFLNTHGSPPVVAAREGGSRRLAQSSGRNKQETFVKMYTRPVERSITGPMYCRKTEDNAPQMGNAKQ
jgi:hypothetical protein